MRVAIVYDRVNKWGGAEKVLLALHEIFPDALLYSSVYDPKRAPWAEVFPKVVPSFLQKMSFMRGRHELLGIFMPIAFESFSFDDYDLVISVTSEAAKGIITKPHTTHICYCLTPTRYLWSHYGIYFQGRTLQAVTKPVVEYLRSWDKIAAKRPDVMVGISNAVCKRIKKYYGRKAELIYPPVDVKKFEARNPKHETNSIFQIPDPKEYYLVVSRLVPYKRIDLAVEVFNEVGLPLVIVGTGSEEHKLRLKSKKNITFKGFVRDEELINLYKRAKGLIFPQEEDFGITAVEAQAAGCPVIAYKGGGALDTVIDGKTGIFFESQTIDSLKDAITHYEDSNQLSRMSKECIKNAQRFSKERFKKEFRGLVEKYSGQLQ